MLPFSSRSESSTITEASGAAGVSWLTLTVSLLLNCRFITRMILKQRRSAIRTKIGGATHMTMGTKVTLVAMVSAGMRSNRTPVSPLMCFFILSIVSF